MKQPRTADPYRELDVIDANAPRFNQAVIGSLALVAFLTGWWRLLPTPLLAPARHPPRAARNRAHAWAPLVPSVRRLLRARPAESRRRPGRGLTPAALREQGRRRLPRRRIHRPRSRLRRHRLDPRPARRGPRARRCGDRHLRRLRDLQAARTRPRHRALRYVRWRDGS